MHKLSDQLIEWYDACGRDLPWRHTTDAYRILVSEVMLQQTQVNRVLAYYERWFRAFPTWQALANASNADVLHAWAGLGYNRRALALRDIAVQVEQDGVPESYEGWLKLKGIGPYTAAALSVFSLKLKELPIDTNIRRVLARVYLGDPYPDPKNDSDILAVSKGILGHERFFDIPQALFDLATIVCTKIPNCEACPLREQCKSADDFIAGNIEPPKRSTPKPKETIHRNKKHPDRIYRGRILKLVRENGPQKISDIGKRIDALYDGRKDRTWLVGMLQRMQNDGMIRLTNDRVLLA